MLLQFQSLFGEISPKNNFMMTLVHEKKCNNYKFLYTSNINSRNSSITHQSEVCKSYQGQFYVLLCIHIQTDLTIAFRPLWFVFPVYEFFLESNESLAAKGLVIRTCLNPEPYVGYEQVNTVTTVCKPDQ